MSTAEVSCSYHVRMIKYDGNAFKEGPALITYGATRAVSGSMHLLATEKHQILLDCGLRLEPHSQYQNAVFPFKPTDIDAVVLSHAHLDHSGNLPTLVSQGFHGPIYCTPATRDLLVPLLNDSTQVQKRKSSYGDAPLLYHESDVDQTLSLIKGVPYGKTFSPVGDEACTFLDAGHVLGSASVHVRFSRGTQARSVTFTGDLGRLSFPFLPPASSLPDSDLIVSEATYGGRLHDDRQILETKLATIVQKTIDQGGKVLIPAFSLGRVHLMVHTLMQLIRQGKLDAVPIYVDSPLAIEILEIMKQHYDLFTTEVRRAWAARGNFLQAENVHYVLDARESMAIAENTQPGIIIASSGMGEGGRIIQHLKNAIDDPRCTVLLVSHQSEGSLGSRLLRHEPTVRFAGRDWNKWAEVVQLQGFSGHADHRELKQLLLPHVERGTRIKLVHGEERSLQALQKDLNESGSGTVQIAEMGESTII